MGAIQYIDEVPIKDKRVLVRVDYNVPLKKDGSINDDARIVASLPTLQLLLQNNNRVVLLSHFGKPKGRDNSFSLKPVAERLQVLFPGYTVHLIDDFLTEKKALDSQTQKEIFLLENTRFYEGEKKNDIEFSKQLASLADVFVSDAFGSVHRAHASVAGVARLLPSYGGLLLKREVETLKKVTEAPERPVVAIIAGAKISSKIGLIKSLLQKADYVLIGGAMANNFLKAKGMEIGKGLIEPEFVSEAEQLLEFAKSNMKNLVLPSDRRIGLKEDTASSPIEKKVEEIQPGDETLDIGPDTEKKYTEIIQRAKTIIWNGPVGYFENPQFAQGSIAVFQAIIANQQATSIVGGGDTLSVIKRLPGKEKITHISTGGGAMLELIEKGTLPGLEALSK